MQITQRAKIASDQNGKAPPTARRAPMAPSDAATSPMTRPNVLPASKENPPQIWMIPRIRVIQPQV